MQIPVLIEPVNANGYRATTGEPLALSAEAATRELALEALLRAWDDRLKAGVEIAHLEFPSTAHPLAPYAGMFKDNPLFESWQEALAEYRRLGDEEPEGP